MSFHIVCFKCRRWKYVRCAKLLAEVVECRGLKERNIGSLITVRCDACQFQRGVETPFSASMLPAPGRPLVSEANAMAGRPIPIDGSWSASNMAVACAQRDEELVYYVWWKRQVELFLASHFIVLFVIQHQLINSNIIYLSRNVWIYPAAFSRWMARTDFIYHKRSHFDY